MIPGVLKYTAGENRMRFHVSIPIALARRKEDLSTTIHDAVNHARGNHGKKPTKRKPSVTFNVNGDNEIGIAYVRKGRESRPTELALDALFAVRTLITARFSARVATISSTITVRAAKAKKVAPPKVLRKVG